MISFFKTVSALAAFGNSTPVADSERASEGAACARVLLPYCGCHNQRFNVNTLTAASRLQDGRLETQCNATALSTGVQTKYVVRLQYSPVLRLRGEIILSASSEKLNGYFSAGLDTGTSAVSPSAFMYRIHSS